MNRCLTTTFSIVVISVISINLVFANQHLVSLLEERIQYLELQIETLVKQSPPPENLINILHHELWETNGFLEKLKILQRSQQAGQSTSVLRGLYNTLTEEEFLLKKIDKKLEVFRYVDRANIFLQKNETQYLENVLGIRIPQHIIRSDVIKKRAHIHQRLAILRYAQEAIDILIKEKGFVSSDMADGMIAREMVNQSGKYPALGDLARKFLEPIARVIKLPKPQRSGFVDPKMFTVKIGQPRTSAVCNAISGIGGMMIFERLPAEAVLRGLRRHLKEIQNLLAREGEVRKLFRKKRERFYGTSNKDEFIPPLTFQELQFEEDLVAIRDKERAMRMLIEQIEREDTSVINKFAQAYAACENLYQQRNNKVFWKNFNIRQYNENIHPY